jgi:DNA-binding NarL/FixJ family response regulator
LHLNARAASEPAITCILADDHPAIARAVVPFLERRGFAVVATAADGESAWLAIEQELPDVCIADFKMPRADGLELARRVTAAGVRTRVLIFSGTEDRALAADAFAAGAAGVALKIAPLVDLERAVQVVAEGGFYVDPILGGLEAATNVPARLSNRELDVIRHLADGNSYEEIARALVISPETVRTHAKHAKAKLGAQTRTQAVAVALRESLIA